MEIVLKFLATTEQQILFILPFVIMTVATLALRSVLPRADNSHQSGRMAAYDDLHREAYIAAIIAAAVTVVAFWIRGGPEPFVLVWKPLLSTVMTLPFGYAVALFIGGVSGITRNA
ncbi:MAG: hypothetical protein CMM26_11995 [Rhodospirillaceae bacterium]|mgnify:CR=1 FL=1|nr:hypothetical protein [Rhodospirillaceae bacterium]|tara:strand:- start:3872 stop:4219 length:348 start_codon:yes stop_codon:yes gene_type:complete